MNLTGIDHDIGNEGKDHEAAINDDDCGDSFTRKTGQHDHQHKGNEENGGADFTCEQRAR